MGNENKSEVFDPQKADPQKLWNKVQDLKKEIRGYKRVIRKLENDVMTGKAVLVKMSQMGLLDPRKDQVELETIVKMIEPAIERLWQSKPEAIISDDINRNRPSSDQMQPYKALMESDEEENPNTEKEHQEFKNKIWSALEDDFYKFRDRLKKSVLDTQPRRPGPEKKL